MDIRGGSSSIHWTSTLSICIPTAPNPQPQAAKPLAARRQSTLPPPSIPVRRRPLVPRSFQIDIGLLLVGRQRSVVGRRGVLAWGGARWVADQEGRVHQDVAAALVRAEAGPGSRSPPSRGRRCPAASSPSPPASPLDAPFTPAQLYVLPACPFPSLSLHFTSSAIRADSRVWNRGGNQMCSLHMFCCILCYTTCTVLATVSSNCKSILFYSRACREVPYDDSFYPLSFVCYSNGMCH
jgi:hypothetical protein